MPGTATRARHCDTCQAVTRDGCTCDAGTYWHGRTPAETDWRNYQVAPPEAPPLRAAGIAVDVQTAIEEAAARGQTLPQKLVQHLRNTTAAAAPLPWDGTTGGRARLRALVPLLVPANSESTRPWGFVASHLPGRSGAECYAQWMQLNEGPRGTSTMVSDGDLALRLQAVTSRLQRSR
jgi:hypothetical protein